MANDKEPQLWLTVLKLAVGAVALALLVWLVLWYVGSYMDTQSMSPPLAPPADWGIANDSPIRNKR